MPTLARSDRSVLGRWWWTVDRWILAALVVIMGFGILLIQASTPAVAVKHGWSNLYFVERHLSMLLPAVAILFWVSLLSPRMIRLLAAVGLAVFLPILIATPFIGTEIKGAARWIHVFGLFSIQASEFVKPFFAVTAATLFTRQCERRGFPALSVNVFLYVLIVVFLLIQPDIGMAFLVSAIWFGQFFLAGLPVAFVGISGTAGIAFLFIA
jgi:cell division protein FtsW